jgi:hypothetical protein
MNNRLLLLIYQLDKGNYRSAKIPARVYDTSPNFSGFPGSAIGTVIFESQIKCHSNSNGTDGLPGKGYLNMK